MKEFIEKFKEIKTIIEENQNIILTAHVNPDGDAVGSGLGLFLTLKENYKDKNIRFVLQDSIPYTTKFLKGSEEIETYNSEEKYSTDLLSFLMASKSISAVLSAIKRASFLFIPSLTAAFTIGFAYSVIIPPIREL